MLKATCKKAEARQGKVYVGKLPVDEISNQDLIDHFSQVFYMLSTPPAKKTEPSNLVLRAQDHKKNPKFKGWQWDLKNPKFKIRSSKERRTKSEITEIVVEKYVFKIPKIQNFRNTRNQ